MNRNTTSRVHFDTSLESNFPISNTHSLSHYNPPKLNSSSETLMKNTMNPSRPSCVAHRKSSEEEEEELQFTLPTESSNFEYFAILGKATVIKHTIGRVHAVCLLALVGVGSHLFLIVN